MTPIAHDPKTAAIIAAEEAIALALRRVAALTEQPVRSVRLIDYEDGTYNVEIVMGADTPESVAEKMKARDDFWKTFEALGRTEKR